MSVVKNDIITYIHSTGLVNEVLSKYDLPSFVPKSVVEDIKKDIAQYVYLYILDHEEETKIVDLFCRNKLKNYIAGIIRFSIMMCDSEFFRKNIAWYAKKVSYGFPDKPEIDLGIYIVMHREEISRMI